MKVISMLILMLVFPWAARAVELEDIRYYAIDYWPPGIDDWPESKDSDVVAYTLKSDPCLIIESEEYGDRRYCQFPNNIDLKKSPKSLYIQRIEIGGNSVNFIVIKNNKKHRCYINLMHSKKSCEIVKRKSLYD